MANKFKCQREVDFGSATYVGRLDFNAICDLEEKLGKPITHFFEATKENESDKLSVNVVRHVLAKAISRKGAVFSAQQIGELIAENIERLPDLAIVSAHLVMLAMGTDPDAKDEEEEEATKRPVPLAIPPASPPKVVGSTGQT